MKLKKGRKVNEFKAYIETHVLNGDGKTEMVQQLEVESFEDCEGKILQFTLSTERDYKEFFCNLNESQVKVLKSMIDVYLSCD